MGASKELFEKMREEEILGEEARAELHWMEQEYYDRFPKKPIQDDNNI